MEGKGRKQDMNYQKLESIANKIKEWWFLGFAGFLFLSAIVGTLSVLGVASWQNEHPHALDNKIFNFDFYWWVVNVYNISLFAMMGIAFFYLFRKLLRKKREGKK